MILPLVGSIPSLSHPDAELVVSLSQQLFISLHHCAPKNTSADEWTAACSSTVHSIHRTADHLFSAVVEQWESTDVKRNQTPKPRNQIGIISDDGPDSLGLPGWQGLQAGAERLRSLLKLLAQFMSTVTNSAVSIPLGLMVDLTSRLNSLTVPFEDSDGLQNTIQWNPEIAKEERENLLAELPSIHSETLNLLSSIAATFEDGMAPVAQSILEQTLWVFEAERFSKDVRASTYHILGILLPILGPSISKSAMSTLSPAIQSCCYDLSPPSTTGNPEEHQNSETKGKPNVRPPTNADSFLAPKQKAPFSSRSMESSPGLAIAASGLLPSLLHYLPVEHISTHVRADIDRTVILTNDRKAMMASVINPGLAVKGRRENPSIAPFLARSYQAELEVENFFRPRMPVLLRGSILGGKLFDAGESDADDFESAAPNRTVTSGNMFMDPSSLTPTTEVNQETDLASTSQNKRSYPIDSEHSTVQPLSDEESQAPRAKTPRFANGHSHNQDPQEIPEPIFSAGAKHAGYMGGAHPRANPSSIPNTSHSVVPPNTVSNVNVTQGGSSAVNSGNSPPADAISDVKNPTGAFAGIGADVGDIGSGLAGHEAEDNSSGDEIPTLDIEPDTDEDDEDTEMGG